MVERYIVENDLGRIVRKYAEVVSAFKETAKRTKYESALTDLRVGIIGGIAVYRWDRLASAFQVGVVAVAWAAVGWGERRPGTSRVAAGGAVPAAGRLGWLAGSVA